MELWFTAELPGGETRELAVEADPATPLSTVLDAVAHRVGVGHSVAAEAPPQATQAGLRLGESGLVDGCAVALDRGLRRPQMTLTVVAGPCAGRTFELGRGQHVLGSGPGVEVHLDDSTVSRRHLLLEVGRAAVQATDLGSTNGTYVEDQLLEGRTRVLPGQLLQVGATVLELSSVDQQRPVLPSNADGRLMFNRPPRARSTYEPQRIRLGAPPSEPEPRSLAVAGLVIPLLLAGGLALITRRLEMLAFGLAGPLVAVLTHVGDRRRARRARQRLVTHFQKEVDDARRRLTDATKLEAAHRRAAAPDPAELVRRATLRLPSLWERWPDDHDFLHLRVGIADQVAESRVEAAPGGSESLRRELLTEVATPPRLPDAPVVIDVADGPIGVAGDRAAAASLVRGLIMQAAVLHSPRDIALAAIVAGEEALPDGDWFWLRWLPHTRPPRPPVNAPLLASSPADVGSLVSALVGRVDAAPPVHGGAIVLLVSERAATDRADLSRVLARGREHGVHVVWTARRAADLPGECVHVVEIDAVHGTLEVRDRRGGTRVDGVVPDGLALQEASSCARALAPLVDAGAENAAAIPRTVRLSELLGPETSTPHGLRTRWSQAPASLAAVLGATVGGRPSTVDLVKHGPHALVAGMTGSGKSELLQSWVASLAATYPPDRLSLLLVDYKGGAAFRSCHRLPHTVGFVTDLDPDLAHRALVSLEAEVERRKVILAEQDASDWATLERRSPRRAPPRLLLVIDEFRLLREEVPDFVTGLVNIANQGRSLAIHLVLATQSPAGVVSTQMQSQMSLRVSLRAGSSEDSTSVLGSPVAYGLDRTTPGRAYVRVGADMPVEVQTAYVGGSSGSGPVRVGELRFEGPIYPAETDTSEDTDLDVLVESARRAAAEAGIAPQPSPWLPPLPALLPLDRLPPAESAERVPFGLVDDPRRQRQLPLSVASTMTASVIVFGAARSGRSTLLRTLATALASDVPPSRLHLYGLDAGSGALAALEDLPHCGGVIPVDDDERVTRLLRHLDREVTVRRQGGGHSPQIVLLVDGYESLAAAHETVEGRTIADRLGRIASSSGIGVAVLLTASRQAGVPGRLAASFPDRLVLRLAERHEYAAFGLVAPTSAARPPGRGLTEQGLEVQIAVAGDDASPGAQAAAISAVGARSALRWPNDRAPRLRVLPTQVALDELPPPTAPGRAFIGLGDATLDPVEVSVVDSHLLVAGGHRSGRSTALAAMAQGLAADPSTELVVLTPRRSPLRDVPGLTVAAGPAECERSAEGLMGRLDSLDGDRWVVVMVDDLDDVADGPVGRALDTVVRVGADRGVRVVAAAETRAAGTSYAGCLVALRRQKNALLLQPESTVDAEMLGARLPTRVIGAMPPGRGYLLTGGQAQLLQVAR